jgi:hypothetical protein
MARLTNESQSDEYKNVKYPLVALIRNYDEKVSSDTDIIDVSLTLVIVTPSTPTKLSEDREVDNYTPILYPIYAELMSVLKNSDYFAGYGQSIGHTKTDNMHLGVDGTNGNSKYLLPDCVDGVIISDLKLSVLASKCSGFTYGPTATLDYINNVERIVCAIVDGGITVQMTDAHNSVLNATYTLVVEDAGYQQELNIGDTKGVTISGLTDGYHIGVVQCNDNVTVSTLYFLFQTVGGVVFRITTSVKFSLENFTVTGFEYTDYPFDAVTRTVYSKALIQAVVITQDGGNIVDEALYTPSVLDTTETTFTITQGIPATYNDVTYAVTIDGQTIQSTSYYKTVLN